MAPMIEVPYLDAEFEAAEQAAYGFHGYVDEDGDPSISALADAITVKVRKHRALKKTERSAKAIRLEKLMAEVFSNVAGPDQWADQPNPRLAEDLYDHLKAKVWSLVRDDENGAVQQRLEDLNGEEAGLVLLRTSVSSRAQNAVYVTTDWGCLEADGDSKVRRNSVNAAKRHGKWADMVARRNKHLAKKVQKAFELGQELALNAGRDEFAAALEAAKPDTNGTVEDDE